MAKKLKLGALSNLPSGEDEANRDLVESEAAIEAATRGQTMKSPSATADKTVAPSASKKLKTSSLSGLPSGEEAANREFVDAESTTPVEAQAKPVPPAQAESASRGVDGKPGGPEAPKGATETPKAKRRAPGSRLADEAKDDEVRLAQEALAEAEAEAREKATREGALGGNADEAMADLMSRIGGPQGKGAAGGRGAQSGGGQSAPQQVVTASGGAIAESLGHIAAGVVAAPFVALTHAARLLSQRAKPAAQTSSAPATGLMASALGGVPMATTEMISNWKCDKIEETRNDVLVKAEAIRELDAFVVWEDAVLREAHKRGSLPQDVINQMRLDPNLAPLREQMTALWRDHPKVVDDYRRAADTFEKHIKDVQKKYANSDLPIQRRVLEAMENVRENVNDLPGYGKEEGEYTATLAERLRELARVLAEFVNSLLNRLRGRAVTANAGPDIGG
jgi:hypothetical protein